MNIELISFIGEKLIIIQFESLEPVVVPVESKVPLSKTDLFADVSNKADDDEEGMDSYHLPEAKEAKPSAIVASFP